MLSATAFRFHAGSAATPEAYSVLIPTIDDQLGAHRESRFAGSQENHSLRDLRGVPESASRNLTLNAVGHGLQFLPRQTQACHRAASKSDPD